jgi:hypothetical protein
MLVRQTPDVLAAYFAQFRFHIVGKFLVVGSGFLDDHFSVLDQEDKVHGAYKVALVHVFGEFQTTRKGSLQNWLALQLKQ